MGLLSLFKKKKAAPVVRVESGDSSSTRHESFCDLNELIPNDTAEAQPTGVMPKSKKKFAAPTAPEPRSSSPSVSPPSENPLNTVEEEERKSEKEELNGILEEKPDMPKEDATRKEDTKDAKAVTQPVTHEVIHYSPHGTVRASTFSPPLVSDVPFVERKSNIVLNDKNGYKTIRVTQFDGNLVRASEKAMAAPSPVPSSAPPVVLSNYGDFFTQNFDSAQEMPPYKELSLLSTDDDEELRKAAEITQDYETLRAKFDLWQALQSRNRNSPEARQLHMELIQQHDVLMKKLQQVTDTTVPTVKKRPGIATDTFSPWSSNGTSSKMLPHHYRRLGSNDSRPPTAPLATYLAPSNHSLSPTTSTSSEETERSVVISSTTRSISTGHYASPMLRRTDDSARKHQSSSRTQKMLSEEALSRKEERERALQRIIEEANELKRKEYELREASGTVTSVSKLSAVHPSTLARSESPLSPMSTRSEAAVTRPSAQKAPHQRTSSDGNNNSIRNGSNVSSNVLATVRRNTPMVSPTRPIVQHRNLYIPPKTATYPNEMMYVTWSGSSASHVPHTRHLDVLHQKPEKPKTSRPSISSITKSTFSLASYDPERESPSRGRADNAPSLSRHPQLSGSVSSLLTKLPAAFQPTPPESLGTPSPPLTPNASSNIRKVKEAVRQQSLGQKAASKMLHKSQIENSKSIATQGSTNSQNSPNNYVRGNGTPALSRLSSENGEITNNISKMLKQGLPALKKVGAPVEKGGIALGKVLSTSTENKKEPTRTTNNQPTTVFAQLPPLAPPPPPPPPPPTVLASSTSFATIPRAPPPPPSLPHATSLISMRDLESQKTKLKPAGTVEKPVAPMDVRDSLMAEIRNAGGLRALRKTSQN